MEHPPFFTMEEGRPWHDKIPSLHCKNLFVKDRNGGIWLLVMPAHKRADLGRLEKEGGPPASRSAGLNCRRRCSRGRPGR
jgi:hypothetical protein